MCASSVTEWKCEPKAESLIMTVLDQAIASNRFIADLATDLQKHTSSRLFDWLDHVIVPHNSTLENELLESGFTQTESTASYRVYNHLGAQLPRVIVVNSTSPQRGIAVAVEQISDFLMVRGLSLKIEGTPLSGYRRCAIQTENGVTLWVVERRGVVGFEPINQPSDYAEHYLKALEKWKCRPRKMADDGAMMQQTLLLAQELVAALGEDRAAWVVLEAERAYWQSRNSAGQIQKNRQDRLGMGWANHDHHTFRSSRKHFSQLVHLFETLGFHCRERFYAGQEAGWGAQVMENPRARLVLFLDVDLAPHELDIDFAHHQLPDLSKLGTIGLWCALHGDSILQSGMHHLEAQFLFEELTNDLNQHRIRMMEPFSNFPYLKQAFTEGEVWHVAPHRIQKLLVDGKITREQAEKFTHYGAVGSHLENLQRREGYKGFNQKNVSYIIQKTDPRHVPSALGS